MKTTHKETTKKSEKINTQIWKVSANEEKEAAKWLGETFTTNINEEKELKFKLWSELHPEYIKDIKKSLNPKDYLTLAVIIALLGLMVVFNSAIGIGEAKRESKYYEKSKELEMVLMKRQKSVNYILLTYADDYETAYRIAKCESQLGKYRDNWEGSGATGLFQFKKNTFSNYCSGEITNDIDQIICFNKLHPIHPEWWACK